MRYAFDPCPPEIAFRFANGATARSLDEFRRNVGALPADVLHYHREHFHPWVRDVLQDATLAERLKAEAERARDAEQLRRNLDGILERTLRDAQRNLPQAAGASAGTGARPRTTRRR